MAGTRECGETRGQTGGSDVRAIVREHGYTGGRDAGEDCFPERLAGIRTHPKQKKNVYAWNKFVCDCGPVMGGQVLPIWPINAPVYITDDNLAYTYPGLRKRLQHRFSSR